MVTVSALCACGHDVTATSTTASRIATTTTSTSTRTELPVVDLYADSPLIDHVTWSSTAKGRQLQVVPTPAGRADTFPGARDRAWTEVVADDPTANTPGMRDQFLCHWDWARVVQPNKPSWNLEPWRPDVGYQATVDALCNPGGPEG